MTEQKIDPEVYDDPEEGVGEETEYTFDDGIVDYNPAQFELPDDYEYEEINEEEGVGYGEEE